MTAWRWRVRIWWWRVQGWVLKRLGCPSPCEEMLKLIDGEPSVFGWLFMDESMGLSLFDNQGKRVTWGGESVLEDDGE